MIKSGYYFVVCFLCILLAGCQSSKPVGVGTVLQYKQMRQGDLPSSHTRTKTGAAAGAVTGAAAGAATGAAVMSAGMASVMFAPMVVPVLAVSTLMGASVGAGSGATVGFVADQLAKGETVYEYHVKLAETGNVVFVYGGGPAYPPGTHVIINQQKDRLVIKDVVRIV
jgi:hypothetical protein